MSAGTGIAHAERNPSDAPLHLLQIWIVPRTRGLAPRWEQHRFGPDERRGTLLPVVTPAGSGATSASSSKLQIDQDATFFVASLAPGETVSHGSEAGRRAYVFAISGAFDVNGFTLETGDQARIAEEPTLTLTARAASELILIDLP
jgi:redox-sensitive bicupin YhaK (pirin superfamily)